MDPIADMITHIKNASLAGRDSVLINYSNIKKDIAEVLKSEGFVKNVEKKSKGAKNFLSIDLIFDNESPSVGTKQIPKIKGVKRLSKPSKRMYKKAGEIRAVRQGYGIMVLSTPKGVMPGYKAKKAGLGGEALFSIW